MAPCKVRARGRPSLESKKLLRTMYISICTPCVALVKEKKLGKLDQYQVKWHVMLRGVLVRTRYELSHCSGDLDVVHHD